MVLEWIGTWTRAMVPHYTAKLWTAATMAPLDCGPKKPESRAANAAAVPTRASPNCVGGGAYEVDSKLCH